MLSLLLSDTIQKYNQIFYFQLPYRSGNTTTQARINIEQIMTCLIEISQYRFYLVIGGLTKMLQRVNETYQPSNCNLKHDAEKAGFDSVVIILQILERCLSTQSKDTARFEEALNVKLLLREICQFIGEELVIS